MATAKCDCAERVRCNGWTNYETWAVNLWLTNEQGTAEELAQLVREFGREGLETGEAATALREWVEEMAPDLGGTLWADLMAGALSEVNWQEIVRTHLQDQGSEAARRA